MELHLFSGFDAADQADILAAVRNTLKGAARPEIAYLPAGSIHRHFVRETKAFFRGLAKVTALKPEVHSRTACAAALKRANLLLIPGGNTYLMAHRLHTAGWLGLLRERLLAGLPLIAFSAGVVLCGQDILTTNDINCCGCTTFAGLGLVPYNFNPHYPPAGAPERLSRDERLAEYQVFHERMILALEDGAYVQVTDGAYTVRRGRVNEITLPVL
jgi:dipeptidase E